jgi:hypothetical protein
MSVATKELITNISSLITRKVSSHFFALPSSSFDFFNVLIEAISCVTFVAQAVALSTGDAVLSHIMTLPSLNAELAFSHLCLLLA